MYSPPFLTALTYQISIPASQVVKKTAVTGVNFCIMVSRLHYEVQEYKIFKNFKMVFFLREELESICKTAKFVSQTNTLSNQTPRILFHY